MNDRTTESKSTQLPLLIKLIKPFIFAYITVGIILLSLFFLFVRWMLKKEMKTEKKEMKTEMRGRPHYNGLPIRRNDL